MRGHPTIDVGPAARCGPLCRAPGLLRAAAGRGGGAVLQVRQDVPGVHLSFRGTVFGGFLCGAGRATGFLAFFRRLSFSFFPPSFSSARLAEGRRRALRARLQTEEGETMEGVQGTGIGEGQGDKDVSEEVTEEDMLGTEHENKPPEDEAPPEERKELEDRPEGKEMSQVTCVSVSFRVFSIDGQPLTVRVALPIAVGVRRGDV